MYPLLFCAVFLLVSAVLLAPVVLVVYWVEKQHEAALLAESAEARNQGH